MNIHQIVKGLIVAFLLLGTSMAYAQKTKSSGTVMKKQVFRELDMQTKEDTKVHHLRDVSNDTTLIEMILKEIKAGRITAYSNYDHSFTTKLTVKEINDMLIAKPDTVMLVDPVTGGETIKIINHDFDPDAVHKYRLLEEWTFDPSTGNTDIHITGVAPLREIFNEGGTFRGMQAIFWIHYNELVGVLAHYEQYHPDNSLALHIWGDYFLSDVKPK